jgi:hypothetical protein
VRETFADTARWKNKAAVDPFCTGPQPPHDLNLQEASGAVAHQNRQAAFGHNTTGNHSPIAALDHAIAELKTRRMHRDSRS